MTLPIAYLLKMVLVSGVLYTYYHLVLRDKRFHSWNRFYLLAAVLLSVTVPLFHIPVHSTAQNDNRLLIAVWQLLGKDNGQTVQVTAATGLTWLALLGLTYAVVVLTQLGIQAVHLLRLHRLRRRSPSAHLDGITIVTTEDRRTPFSFFRWIFWNRSLQLDSVEGQRMLTHELTHVREGHSVDKVVMQVVCTLFFPVLPLHLMRRELQLIHEFLADQRATRGDDTAAYAELLLSRAFDASTNVFAHSFFHHPLKRRLAMMTRFTNPRFTYLRKLMFLPLTLVLFGLLAFRVERDRSLVAIHIQRATAQLQNAVTVEPVWLRDHVFGPPPPPPARPKTAAQNPVRKIEIRNFYPPDTVPQTSSLPAQPFDLASFKDVLYVIDGQIIKDHSLLSAINPDKIASISVLRGAQATVLYGAQGAGGVVEIRLKANTWTSTADDNQVFTKVEYEAQFPGGDAAWNEFVRKNIEAHMDELQAAKVSGTCEVLFIVRKDGSITGVQALATGDSVLARVCVNAIANGPHWIPATQYGRQVNAFRRQKITFQLPNE